MATEHHVLTLERGRRLVKPSCSCGWVGVPVSRRIAERQYRAHAEHARHGHASPAPAELTPADELPEVLR